MSEYLCPYVEILKNGDIELTCSVDICPYNYKKPAAFDKQMCISRYPDCFRKKSKVVKS